MRSHLIALPLALVSAPSFAETRRAEPTLEQDMQVPPELTDPRMTGRLMDALQILSKSFLDLPVGEVQAAMEGRPVTPADRRRTVASETGMSERDLQQKIDQCRPAMESAQRALASALPAIMKSMAEMGKELEKVGANVPRPDYPKR